MTTPASPAVQYTCKDGAKITLRELTLHPSDDLARKSLRIAEEFLDATIGFQKAALTGATPELRKRAVEYAAEMRHERDLALRAFLYELSGSVDNRKLIEEKLLPECGDTETELILRICREGNVDGNRSLFDKLKKVFVPIEFEEQLETWIKASDNASLKPVYEKLSTLFVTLPASDTTPKQTS
jgi:hypothetical protein